MKCFKCGEDKSLADFYKKDRTCKTCRCALQRANRIKNVDYYRKSDLARGCRSSNKARAKYPNQYKAQTAVNNAIRNKRLARRPCEICLSSNTHAHHDDYNQPLKVRWLCPIHHKEWHDKNGEALNRI